MTKDQINKDLFSLNPLPSWISDNETLEILDVNIAAIEHYGYSRKEFLSLTLKDLRPPEEVPNLIRANTDIKKRDGNIYLGIFTHQKKDGTLIQMEINGHRVDFNDRQCLLVVCQDVTEKIEQEEKILQSEQRFKALVQEGADLIAILDAEGKYLYVSPTSISVLGIAPEEFIGRSPFEFIHPDDAEKVSSSLEKIATEKKVLINPFRFRNKNKEWRWIETVFTNMTDNPTINGIVANSRDITEQMEAQKQLEVSEQFNRTVLESSPDCVKVIDTEGRIQYMNYNGLCLMEIEDFSKFKDKGWWTLWGAENEGLAKEAIKKALKGETAQFAAFCPTAKGTPKWWDVMVSPVGETGKPIQQLISVSRDVSEQKQKELEKELLGKISLNFSYENNLLDAATALCQTLNDYGHFDFVELWLPNIEDTHIKLFAFESASPKADTFYEHSKDIKSFTKVEGLPGIVWDKKATLLWDDISKKDDFVRKEAAQKAGLASAMGIPLLFNEKIVGVLLVATHGELNHLKKYKALFEHLQQFLGSEINRKKLENDLQHLYDAIPDVICITDLQSRFLKINKAGCDLIGCTEEEILHNTFEKFVHPDDKDISHNDLDKLNKGGKTYGFENRYINKSGETIWLSWTSNANLQEGLIYATARNITEEKRLRELNRQVSKLVKIGSWEVNFANNEIIWSEMVHELHETDPKTFKPDLEGSIDFYREDFKELVRQNVEKCVSSGIPFDFEAVLVTAKKNERWVRAIGNAEMVEGKCQRIYGSFQDIHERKEAELRLQSLADNLPGVVFQYFLYPDGTDALRYVTKGSEQLWGFSPEAVIDNIQLVWDQIKAGGNFEEVKESIVESVQNKSKWKARWKYILPNGDVQYHLGYGTPNFLVDGTVLFNSVVLDVTQEAKNEELLELATDLARIGSWEINLIGNNLIWSDMVHELHETDPKSFEPDLETGIQFYREDFREMVTEEVAKCVETGEDFDFEAVIITAKKNERWVRAIGHAEMVDGKCQRIYGSFQDIDLPKTLELQVREILESISEAFYSLDKNWNFTYFNKEAEILLKRKSEDVLGKNKWEEFPAAKGTIIEEKYRCVAKTGKPEIFEYWYPGNGSWYEINAYPSKGGVSAFFKNIDDRKKAAAELQKAYEEKNNILESIGDAFFTVDKNWIVTYWNKVAEQLVGRKREDIIGKNLWDEYPDARELAFGLQYEKAMKTGESVIFEEYYPGLKMWLEVTAYPSQDGLSVFFKDITSRKEADIRLLQANERFEKVTQATNDAIWDWNIKDDTLYWGGGFTKLFGYEVSKITPSLESWTEHIYPDDRDRVVQSIHEAIEDSEQTNWVAEYSYRKSDGTFAKVIDRGIVIRNVDGKPMRMVGAMTDITEQKNHEKQLLELNESLQNYAKDLERSNEELESFAFITSHDLQEPLRMISSFMDQLKRKYGDQLDEKALQYIHYASDGAKRMKRIILDLLEYSRAAKPIDSLEEVDLNEILSEFKQLRRKVISEKAASISSVELPTVTTYKAGIAQVFNSLLDNAIKYAEEGKAPQIEIKAIEKEAEWEFSIKDNGIGIDSEFFEKIFLIFQRLHNRDQYAGTGIGLSIAKRHVEFLGGKIWLKSELGKGATFYFSIPKTQ